MNSKRRTFLKVAGLSSLFLVACPAGLITWGRCGSYRISLQKARKLMQVGGWQIMEIKGQQLLLIRDTPASIKVFAANCSNCGENISYKREERHLFCKNCKSSFGLDGKSRSNKGLTSLKCYQAELGRYNILVEIG